MPSAPNGVLEPGKARSEKREDDQRFRVVFSGPEGRAADASELTVVFNRSLRPLDRDVPTPPVRMTPALPGHWIWVGARAIRFVPAGDGVLPQATRVEVEVPATLRAEDGSVLGKAHVFSFETPRPTLTSFSPTGGGHTPDTSIHLYFNQPIEPAELEKNLVLQAERGGRETRLAFRVERPDANAPKHLRLVVRAPLPLASRIAGTIATGLRSMGPLPSSQPQTFELETYGPLSVVQASCFQPKDDQCGYDSSPYLSFSNAVSWARVKRAVRITPAVPLRWESWQDDAETTSDFVVPARFEPGRSYTITIAGDLVDRFGQKLGTPFSRTFRFADIPPSVEIGVQGENIANGGSSVPVGAVNLDGYDLLTASLRPEDALRYESSNDADEMYRVLVAVPGSRNERVAARGPKNRIVRRDVNLTKLLAGGQGVAAIGVSNAASGRFARIVKSSDLAVTAKLGSEGSLVWVTRLSNASPVADADVEILRQNERARRYKTDKSGLVRIPSSDFALAGDSYQFEEKALVLARSGSDWTYEAAQRAVAPWRLPVSTSFEKQNRRYGMLFTDRGIYRPGDEVQVKGIVRRETRSGNELVSGEKLELALSSPNGEVIEQKSVVTSAFGTFTWKAKVPASGDLGSYQLSSVRPNQAPELQAAFEVAEYRPAEFSVTTSSTSPSYEHGDTARFETTGAYLFGAPMAGASARYTLSRGPEWFEVPRHEGFVVDGSAYRSALEETPLAYGTLASGEGKLDARGRFAFDQKLALPGQRGAERIVASVEVTDPSRQVIAGEASTLVHPANFYVGIELPKDYFLTTPAAFSPRVLALTPRGEHLVGKKVRLELVKRRWTLARDVSNGERAHSVSRVVDAVVGSCELTTGAEPRSCKLDLTDGGAYLVVARATDEKKNPIESAIAIYALGSGEFGWGDDDQARVEIVPNKKEYRVGETAKLLVKNPFKEAEALVTVERAGIYRSERRKLVGSMPTLEIPITEELRPNVYVAVHLVRGRTEGKKEKDVGAAYRMGYADLRVDPEARRLKVQVKPDRAEVRPGADVKVDLEVTDARGAGKATELAVFAVDEGVLALTGYATPDPVPVFTASRPLAVATLETRESLARIGLSELEGMIGANKGRDGGGGGEAIRRDFRQTAFFEPSVVTDERGRASVRFKVPDALTTYRVMAVAVSKDDRYGFGAEKVVVNKKLMARPALPRFLRAGDVVDAGIIVSKKGLPAGSVRVTASIQGLVVEGQKTRDVEVEKDGSLEVRFRLRAARAGTATLRFDVSGGGESDRVEVTRRIDAPQALEAVALYGQTEGRATEKLGGLASLDPEAGGLDVRLASTALVGLDTSMDELVTYPYACTEQLSSRLLPLVPLRGLATDFGLALPKNVDAVAERTVAEILSRQRSDGGFALWPESRESLVWVSSYALFVLHEASRAGATVQKPVFERGRAYLRAHLASDWERDPASSALALDVLAMLGEPDLGYTKRLLERGDRLPLFAKGLVLHSLAVGNPPAALVAPLVRDIENHLRVSGESAYISENVGSEYAPLMDSPTRTSAIVLRALLAKEPKHPLVVPLVRGLLGARKNGGYRNTQENAFVLLALDAYRRAYEARPPSFTASASLADKKLLDFRAEGKSTRTLGATLGMSEVSSRANALLSFEKEGSGTLFYQARLRYAPRELPKAPVDQGFFVSKTLRAIRPEELAKLPPNAPDSGVLRFHGGDLVVADLLVVTPSAREFVVVDDPLPAGFEPVDTGLLTTSSAFSSAGSEANAPCDACDDSASDEPLFATGYGLAWARQELRDDRALFFVDHMPGGIFHYRYFARATSAGRFVVPPTKAEGMYEPETFGRTAANVVEVE